MRGLFNPRLKFSTNALALVILTILSPLSGAMAGQFSIGIIEYNAKASQGGWTNNYGKPSPPLPLQIDLIADKINDTSNPSPVQFIALVQAGDDGSRDCPNDYLISCALARKGLTGWNTIISICKYDQTQLAYSSDWELVPKLKQNPLVDSYDRDFCWAELSPINSDHGRPYNIAYFQNRTSKEMLLFVIVHMPHGQPDNCQGLPCPYGQLMWDVPRFKRDVRRVVGSAIDLKKVRLVIAGDMNDLGHDADPKGFAPIFDDFGDVKISKQAVTPPDPTCCADRQGYHLFFDRIVTNGSVEPSYEVVYLKGHDYPLDKLTKMPAKSGQKPKFNEEHKATYGVAKFD
jgi:hypothetical protein